MFSLKSFSIYFKSRHLMPNMLLCCSDGASKMYNPDIMLVHLFDYLFIEGEHDFIDFAIMLSQIIQLFSRNHNSLYIWQTILHNENPIQIFIYKKQKQVFGTQTLLYISHRTLSFTIYTSIKHLINYALYYISFLTLIAFSQHRPSYTKVALFQKHSTKQSATTTAELVLVQWQQTVATP